MNELLPWLQTLTFWHWMVLGVALVIVELLLPGIWFLWLGLAPWQRVSSFCSRTTPSGNIRL